MADQPKWYHRSAGAPHSESLELGLRYHTCCVLCTEGLKKILEMTDLLWRRISRERRRATWIIVLGILGSPAVIWPRCSPQSRPLHARHTLPCSMPERRLPAHKSQKRLQRRARGRAVRDSWKKWHLPMLSPSS